MIKRSPLFPNIFLVLPSVLLNGFSFNSEYIKRYVCGVIIVVCQPTIHVTYDDAVAVGCTIITHLTSDTAGRLDCSF